MMAELSEKKIKASSWGLLGNYKHLCKTAMVTCATQSTSARKRRRQMKMVPHGTIKRLGSAHEPLDSDSQLKRAKLEDRSVVVDHDLATTTALTCTDTWEVDSGFCSEASPPASGRNSPCLPICLTSVVALDCEMVGTGPRGQTSELARCSVLDYHGNVLYDKYVRPCEPVTDFRTRWSGIQRHHLQDAMPFAQARDEVLQILRGKVVVGHSIHNDFEVLDINHPGHMIRDTCTTHFLGRLAGFPRHRSLSLKILSSKLLNRKIQASRRGHCSVEDARAALDLYKLVEGEWEEELQNQLRDDDIGDAPKPLSFASSDHYMQDQYWPDYVITDSQ